MPWYGWILMYGMIIPYFALGIFVHDEMPWWFVPACIACISLSVFGVWVHGKFEQKKQQQRSP